MTPLYPVFLNIEQTNCLVIGGGGVALRKVKSLLECGAVVEVISPQVKEELRQLAQKKRILWQPRRFEEGDEAGRFLVFAATGDMALNRRIAELCREKNVFLNAVDDPENCSFQVPAILRRGPVCAAVSTAGASPLLAGRLRDEIAAGMPEEMGFLAQLLGELRPRVTASSLTEKQKNALKQALLQEGLQALSLEKTENEVREKLESCMSSWLD